MLLIGLLIFVFLSSLSSADISLICSSCSVGNCLCAANCTSGNLYVYISTPCTGIFNYSYLISNNQVTWYPFNYGNYNLKVLCDDGNVSSCLSINLNSPQPATSPTQAGGGGGGGGGFGCMSQGFSCSDIFGCCSGLTCINSTCIKTPSTTTSTTAFISTFSSSTETTSSASESTEITTSQTTNFPISFPLNYNQNLIAFATIIFIILATVAYFASRPKKSKIKIKH